MKASGGLMHPTLASAPPQGPGWLFEVKWDGVRALLCRDAGRVRVVGRSGQDFTSMYPEIAAAVSAVADGDLTLDAELVALDPDGRANFHRLQRRMHDRAPSPGTRRATPVTAMVFDALRVRGRDVRSLGLLRRKALLRPLLPMHGPLRYVDHVRDRGREFLALAAAHDLEGIVAKKASSPYVAGRAREWVKIKCTRTATFVIGGYTIGRGARARLGALHLGRRAGRGLTYVGRVGSGIDDRSLTRLSVALSTLGAPHPPFTDGDVPRGPGHRWVRPRLACTVRFTEWTDDGRLRHPVFTGLA